MAEFKEKFITLNIITHNKTHMAELKVGDLAPDFTGNTQNSETLSLSELKGGKTVLYFYPKDNTSGCTLEAKSLRDGKAALAERGYRIVGVRPDREK